MVHWAHCPVCAALHYQYYRYFVCCAALLGAVHCTALHCVCHAALHLWAVGSRSVAMHCHTACGQGAVEVLQLSAAPPGGCLGAVGSRTAAMHCHTAVCIARALCASVLLYSLHQCTVPLGRCGSADAYARSHMVHWAHCPVCAALHYRALSVLLLGAVHCTALHCVCHAALHLWAVGSGGVAMHCHTACGQGAVEVLHLSTAPPGGCLRAVGSRTAAMDCDTAWGQCARTSGNAPPHCLGAVGSGTPLMLCRTARGQWAGNFCNAPPHCLWAVRRDLLQCTATLPGGSGQ